MKKLMAIAAMAMLVGVTVSWASTNSFQVDIKGTITTDTGKVKVDTAGLLSTNGTMLVLTETDDFGDGGFYVEIDEVDIATTNVVNWIFYTWGGAEVGKGFRSQLENWNSPETFSSLPAMHGELWLEGKAKVKNDVVEGISAKVSGVWKVSTWTPTNEPAAYFKGNIKTKKGAVPVPNGFDD